MRSCKKAFEYVYLFVGGDVRICPWNGIVIGNILENSLEEIWKGKKATEIRAAFLRGELLGCGEQYCPLCIQKRSSLEFEPEELTRLNDELPDLPEIISLAYDERCNHACPSCRQGIMKFDKEYLQKLDGITKNIEPYLSDMKRIITNGIGDLFVSTEIVDMLSRLKPKRKDFSMFLETNGVLFKDNWGKISHLGGRDITVSVTPNSFDRETYRYLAGKDDLKKFEKSMEFITDLKHQGAISRIRIIMVIQDSNFRQIPDFIKRCIEYDADDIVLRPIFKWFYLQEDEFLYKNVLNPAHPYHKEYLEIIENPICKDKRVFNWGFVDKQECESFPTLAMK
ncbi:MAG: radical SAM protein, partial [Selenomonadaceae bacterium]|nr:radical SAM protein [Selenomonadaceae bacterium]